MIYFDNVWKAIKKGKSRTTVFEGISAILPSNRRLAILGLPGSGKTTFIDLMSGLQRPDHGSVHCDAAVSIPIGKRVGLIPAQSARRNCIFTARLYGMDPADLIRFVASAANLGPLMDKPLADLAPDASHSFRLALGYGLPFDTYVVDGTPYPKSSEAQQRFTSIIHQRAETSGLIICTGNAQTARSFCDMAAILNDGHLKVYASFDRALSVFDVLKARYAASADVSVSKTNLLVAKRALRRGDLATVEGIVEAESEQDGENGLMIWLLGEVALSRGERRKGIKLIMEACETDLDAVEPWVALPRLASDERDPDARKAIASLLLKHKTSRIRRSGAKLIESFGDFAAALHAWREVVKGEPIDSPILLEAARMETQLGHFANARVIVDRALGLDPASWQALLAKAKIEEALQQHDEMSAAVISLARVRPDIAKRFVRPMVKLGRHDVADELRRMTETSVQQMPNSCA